MPKMKSHRAARKRFRVSKSGKIKHSRPGRRHLLSAKTPKRRRKLRNVSTVSPADAPKLKRILGKV